MTTTTKQKRFRIGYVPLIDCAPVVMASELGLFEKHGVDIELRREIGWATIRDKIIHGELHAAQAAAALPLALSLGIGPFSCECVTGLILSAQSSTITLSTRLWDRGVRDAAALREEILRRRGKPLAFGTMFPLAASSFLLRKWFASAGINPDLDVHLIAVPFSQLVKHMKTGHLEGFCSNEPFNTLAIEAGAGCSAITSAEFFPEHPETALMVRRGFSREHHDTHVRMIAALIEACRCCARPENRELLIKVLSRSEYLDLPNELIRRSLGASAETDLEQTEVLPSPPLFGGDHLNEPSEEKAIWNLRHLLNLEAGSETSNLPGGRQTSSAGLDPAALIHDKRMPQVFRSDLFNEANQRLTDYEHELNSTLQIA